MDNFQQTVDLRDQMEKQRKSASPPVRPPLKKNATPLEKIYRGEEAGEPEKDLRKISQPKAGWSAGPARLDESLIRLIVFILAILLVGATIYFLFFRTDSAVLGIKIKAQNWYAVKLADGTVYYGQVFNLKANPLTIKNAYYNYDQEKLIGAAKDQPKTIQETGNLRLVKRGKETQGGDGSIIVYPSNGWPLMEPLRPDSKVLEAILEYEK